MISDRDQVIEMMVSYGAAIDRRDWTLFRRCFTHDVLAVYEGFGEFTGYDAVEEFVRPSVEPLDATQHMLTNFLVKLDGDAATFQCYVQAQHIRQDASGGHLFTVGGPYDNGAIRTPDGWRMDRFRFTATWTAGNPDVLHHVEMDERVPR
jgi:hypothetical protein